MVITVGRQYGSGGREIGTALANKLGIAHGDTVRVSSNRGYIKAKAVVTKRTSSASLITTICCSRRRRRKAAFVRSCSTASTSAPRAFFIPLRWTRIPSPCTM